jgi:glycosyltransferase involved in cell wall biosynthesis
VTLHDLYPYDIPQNFGFPKVFFNRLVLQECVRSADAIACVSESTRLSLTARMPQAISNKAVTVYNCVEPSVAAVKPSFLDDWAGDPFFLCVAQHRRNKNILLLLQTFKELLSSQRITSPSRLLIVGMSGPETAQIYHYIHESGLRQHVMLTSGITDSELQWCYRNCEVLLAPSVIEGFGLPVAEALLAGCRVVCSDIPAFRELGANLCRFVALGPEQVEAFASAVCDAVKERRPSPIALPKLSPTVVANQYMRIYGVVAATFTSSSRSPAFTRPFARVPGVAERLKAADHTNKPGVVSHS